MAAGNSDNEAEAESNLAALGIVPRNGWIADYPVTPDIIGELYKSVRNAASSGKLSLGSEEAQQRLTDVIDELGLTVKTADYGAAARDKTPEDAAPEMRFDRGQRGAAPPVVQPAPVPGRDQVPRGDDRGGVQRR